MSRTFLFDIGNVLLHFDFTVAAQRFAAMSEAGADEVLARLSPFKNALESGAMPAEDFVAESSALIGFRGSREEFVDIWNDIFTENSPMIDLAKKLAPDHRLILFSNTNGLHKDWFIRRYGVFSHFAGGVFSHEVRCMKPEEAFYQQAVTQFGIDPAETFYIDDLAENIAAGQRFGLVCHHYASSRHGELESDVARWLHKA
jgi:putative hydrolase of the HAD superfamily